METMDFLVVFRGSGADVLTLPLHSIYTPSADPQKRPEVNAVGEGSISKKMSLLQELLQSKVSSALATPSGNNVLIVDLCTECGCTGEEVEHIPNVGAYLCCQQTSVKEDSVEASDLNTFFPEYKPASKEWKELVSLCEKLRLEDLLKQLQKEEFQHTYNELLGELQELKSKVSSTSGPLDSASNEWERKRQMLQRKAVQIEEALRQFESAPQTPQADKGQSGAELIMRSARDKDKLEVELQSIRYMCDQTYVEEKNQGKSLAYNLIVAGVTGTGKSSSLNTILDRQICAVSGAQAQGTRGCNMQDGSISEEHFVSFIDTQGLGADTSITDTELLSQIMRSTESVYRMGIINNILISMDLASRQTPAAMANQLTLMELFSEVRTSCFLILTKWNTNSVQAEWNKPLRTWMRKWRRARNIEDITEEPPSYHEMYQAYCNYIVSSMNNEEDGGSFSKMGTFLAFFESRVLWMYNLDGIQIEDKEDGELAPHIHKLYEFYRNKALETLYIGRKHIDVDSITFLKRDELTLGTMAKELVDMRDTKISSLEGIGRESRKLSQMESVFKDMVSQNATRMQKADFDRGEKSYMEDIADIAGLKESKKTKEKALGCILS